MAEIKIILIPKGAAIMDVLSEECQKQGLEWGQFEEAVGEIKHAEIVCSHPNGRMENVHVKNPCLIQTVSGEIKKNRQGFDINLKMKVTPGGLSTIMGKLLSATAHTDVEIAIRKINTSKIIMG